MNTVLFNIQMAKHNDTQVRLSEDMGIAQSALSMRINGKIDFRQNEINFIRKRYHLSDQETVDIFFPDDVSESDTSERGA